MFRSIFWSTIIVIGLLYLVLKLIFPYFAMRVVEHENPLPIPSVAMALYIMLALIGAYIYVTSDPERKKGFLAPIRSFLRGGEIWRGVMMSKVRVSVLVLIPLLAGGMTFRQFIPAAKSPTGIRIQHSTMPGRFEGLENPFRNPTEEMVRAFIEQEALTNISQEGARKALVQKYIQEGRVLFEKNCRPCHGVAAGGDGPMARAFRLKPANFRDPGTIATVVESFAFWRVNKGGRGLPKEGTPWDSAMPIWENDLSKEEMWKIILAEYDIAEVEPRIPEKSGGE